MKGFHPGGWGSVSIILLFLFSQSLPLSPTHARSLGSSPPSFSDGNWEAEFSVHSSASMEVTNIETIYHGNMALVSSGGNLTGEWTLTGSSIYYGDITGGAALHGGGKVEGSSSDPKIFTSTFVVDVDVIMSGVAFSQSVDMGSGGNMSLTLVSATCNQVLADIVTPVTQSFDTANIASSTSGSFVAIRSSDLSAANKPEYMKEVGDLLDQAEAIKKKALTENSVDFTELNALVTSAETLSVALKKNIDCNQGGKKQFLVSITDAISDLAYFALQNPQLFTTEELSRLAYIAIQVGAMGSGAANSAQAADLQSKFVSEFNDRLSDADTNKNCDDATQLLVASMSLGDLALIAQAKSVVKSTC